MDESKFKIILVPLIVAVLSGLVVWGINELYSHEKAVPVLEYQTMNLRNDFAEIKLKSKSSAPFFVWGVAYRILEVVRQAPQPTLSKPSRHQPQPRQPRWFNQQTAPGSAKCGAPISPDDVVVNPGPPIINQWLEGDQLSSEVVAYSGEVIHFRLHDPPRAGARYRVEVVVVYGEAQSPKTECVPEFEIDVVGK